MEAHNINLNHHIDANTMPTEFAEKMSRLYLKSNPYASRKGKGQFFTMAKLAKHLAGIVCSDQAKKNAKILDLGAGTGILTCALVEELCERSLIRSIKIDLIENDANVAPYLNITLDYLKLWCSYKGINLTYNVIPLDICHNDPFENLFFSIDIGSYDIAITNPPYMKISKGDKYSSAYSKISNGQMNLYSIFLYVAIQSLNDSGRAGFITPQSYFNGNSFSKLRDYILSHSNLTHVVVGIDRHTEFLDESVLQRIALSCYSKSRDNISVNIGLLEEHEDERNYQEFDYSKIVRNNIIYAPTSLNNEIDLELLEFKYRLADFGLTISTGSVVPHETPQILSFSSTDIPLIWLKHVKHGEIEWPIENFNRPQYLTTERGSKKILSNGNYILLRRCAFSETEKHLYCSVFSGIPGYTSFALENHVNFIFANACIDDAFELILDIHNYLTSDYASYFFKTRCGNTQINVSDIKALPIPSRERLRDMRRG